MKVKTSVMLSEELLKAIDSYTEEYRKKNRSDFIEVAVWAFLRQMTRQEINSRDLEIINRRAEYLNQEADDVLTYQIQL
jgi:metal-responsive CopG/Arc/MetJ family transcriptional regulator